MAGAGWLRVLPWGVYAIVPGIHTEPSGYAGYGGLAKRGGAAWEGLPKLHWRLFAGRDGFSTCATVKLLRCAAGSVRQ
jgi:hypothetical protein